MKKVNKRFTATVCALALILGIMPLNISVVHATTVTGGAISTPKAAITTLEEGACGDNITWTATSDGVLTVMGTGVIEGNNSITISPEVKSRITRIVVGEGITDTGENTFYEFSKVSSVELPSTLTKIGSSFSYCKSLQSISIPTSVRTISRMAFADSGLVTFTIPDTVISVGEDILIRCTSLNDVVIGNGFTISTDAGSALFSTDAVCNVYTDNQSVINSIAVNSKGILIHPNILVASENTTITAQVDFVKESTFSIFIPKRITLDTENFDSTFTVKVVGDIAADELLKISLIEGNDITLVDAVGSEAPGTITINKTEYLRDDISGKGYVDATNYISASGLTAGKWTADLPISITLMKVTP